MMTTYRRSPWTRSRSQSRRGTTLVLFAVCLVPLFACVALAIDLGMLLAASTQINDAADACAMAGARSLNGNTANSNNNNYAAVVPMVNTVVQANSVLGNALTSSQVSTQIGRYTYVTASQQFQGQFPGPSTQNWNMVQSTVSANVNGAMGFSKIFNYTVPNLQAISTAVYRPRDVCVIVDFSGSMRFSSLLGLPYSGDRTSSNNEDSANPAFGAYSSGSAGLLGSDPSLPYQSANISTTTSDGRPPIIQDFYTNSTGTAAFTAASSAYATTPGGDNCLTTNKNTTSTYAQTAGQALNISNPTTSSRDATFESQGYKAYGMVPAGTKGYTAGPGYWGKTFFLWPPDPTKRLAQRVLQFRRWQGRQFRDVGQLRKLASAQLVGL